MWGLNPSLLREKLRVGCTLLILCMHCTKGGLTARVYLRHFYLFQCRDFLVHLMCKSCSTTFWISFGGNFAVGNCTFSVSMEGREFRNPFLSVPPYPFILNELNRYLEMSFNFKY